MLALTDTAFKYYSGGHYEEHTATGKEKPPSFEEQAAVIREKQSREKQFAVSESSEAEKRAFAAEQAAKRRRLARYAAFLRETSIQRADEELEMIAKRTKKNAKSKRYKVKAVYSPVSCKITAQTAEKIIGQITNT